MRFFPSLLEPRHEERVAQREHNGTDEQTDDSRVEEATDCTDKDDENGHLGAASQEKRLQDVVDQSDKYAPHEKQDPRQGMGAGVEHIDHGRDEDEGRADLDHGEQETEE